MQSWYWRGVASALMVLGVSFIARGEALVPDDYSMLGLVADQVHQNQRLDNQRFKEYLDPFTGKVRLAHVDVHIPGNGGFDIDIVRVYASPDDRPQASVLRSITGFGWTMHFGRLLRTGSTNPGQCTNLNAATTVDNPVFETPAGERKVLFQASTAYDFGSGLTWITNDFWQGRCASGEVTLFSPDGMRYEFDPVAEGQALGTGTQYVWYVDRIVDRNGNWLQIKYHAGTLPRRIASLSASDGRTVTYSYNASGLISAITANGLSWNYAYSPDGLPLGLQQLRRVTLPAGGLSWQYTYYPDRGSNAGGSFALQRLTYPEGGTILYDYGYQAVDPLTPSVRFSVVTAKTTSATSARSSGTWSISYVRATNTSNPHDVTTVVAPNGIATYEYRHFGLRGVANDNVWRVGLLVQKRILRGASVAQSEAFTWGSRVVSDENYFRPGFSGPAFDNFGYAPVLTQRVILRNDRVYTTALSNIDAYGNARTITETGIDGTANVTRTINRTFCQNLNAWILDIPKDETIVNVGSLTRQTDSRCNVTSQSRFGVTTFYTYSAAGDVASSTDARGFRIQYQNHKRGIAQREIHPAGLTPADTTQVVQIDRNVDDAGNVLSETNGRRKTYAYSYDGLNRLRSIGYPRAGATDATIAYGPNTRTLTRGPYTETLTIDGFGAPATINRGGVVTAFNYDALGRKTFQSHPFAAGTTGARPGTRFVWGALPRIGQIIYANNGITAFNYSQGAVQVTDQRSFVTTYRYRAYGDPEEKWLRQIAPASIPAATLAIARNGLDQVTSLVQNGVTRSFGYDSRKFLVSETHPEIGVVQLGRDPVGNLATRTVGTSPSARTTIFTYDGMSRLRSIDYPGATPDVTNAYTGTDKLASTAMAGGAARAFDYDDDDNLIQERLSVDGQSFVVDYGYNGNDALGSITYPAFAGLVSAAGRTVLAYGPDALGRPTRASPVATLAQFYPSGQLKTLVHANGARTDIIENVNRLLVNGVTHTSGALAVANLTTGYDGAGNLQIQRDTVNPTLYNWNFASDALNRLVTTNRVDASGTMVVTSGSFAYDGNSNITKQVLGSSTSNYAYDAVRKRLAAVSGGLVRSYAYDVYGNISGDGEFQYVHDDASNLRQILPAAVGGTYAYDGLRRRVKTTLGGVSSYQMHSVNGELLFQYTPAAGALTEFYYLRGQAIGSRTIETAPAARNAITHVHEDAFGNPIAGTAGAGFPVSGTVVLRQAFAPYGTPLAGALSYPLGFQEKTADYGSSILRYDFGARAYDPEIGIFLEFDFAQAAPTHPVAFNPYAYGNGNPYRSATERRTPLAGAHGRVETCAEPWNCSRSCGWPAGPIHATMWTWAGSACWCMSTTGRPWTTHGDFPRWRLAR